MARTKINEIAHRHVPCTFWHQPELPYFHNPVWSSMKIRLNSVTNDRYHQYQKKQHVIDSLAIVNAIWITTAQEIQIRNEFFYWTDADNWLNDTYALSRRKKCHRVVTICFCNDEQPRNYLGRKPRISNSPITHQIDNRTGSNSEQSLGHFQKCK